jgi:glucose-1-phosphate thymidylyltransferase
VPVYKVCRDNIRLPSSDPKRYGVVELDGQGRARSIEEKPVQPKSNFAVTRLYFHDNKVIVFARQQAAYSRGELEISDTNNACLDRNELDVEPLDRGHVWLYSGNHNRWRTRQSWFTCSKNVNGCKWPVRKRSHSRMGMIDRDQFDKLGRALDKSDYGQYLLRIADSISNETASSEQLELVGRRSENYEYRRL